MIKLRLKPESERKLKMMHKKMRPAIKAGMTRGMIETSKHIKSRKLSGQVLEVRTGQLRRTQYYKVKESGDKIIGIQGAKVPYGRAHELGAVIRPKTGQWLTIPLNAAKTASGVARGPARSFSNTFFLKKGGNLLLMQKKGDQIVPLFVLKKEVRIPKRPFLRPGIMEKLPVIRREILKEVHKRY